MVKVIIIHNVVSRLHGNDNPTHHNFPVGTKEFPSYKDATEFCEKNSKTINAEDEYGSYKMGELSWVMCEEFSLEEFNEKLSYGVVA